MKNNASNRRVYLDHASTTPGRREVLDAMLPYFADAFGNPSSIHKIGQRAKGALEKARQKIAESIGAQHKEIVLTAGGTESDNLAIKGAARANCSKGKHLIVSAIEHPAVLNSCKDLEQDGFETTCIPVDPDGVVDLRALESAIRNDTILISVMPANNETGVIQPVAKVAHIAKKRGILVHTDAVQAMGKIPVRVDELGVDLLSISAHKIYGPKGAGVLYVREGVLIHPLLHGGKQEMGRRAGTENMASIVGMAEAVSLAAREAEEESARIRSLRDRLERGIMEKIPCSRLNGHPEKRLPNILNMSFGSVSGESLMIALDTEGVAVSAGAACASGATEPSHVLAAMGLDPARARSSLRFSLGRSNTAEEIDYVIALLAEIISRL